MREVREGDRVLFVTTEPVVDEENEVRFFVETAIDVTRYKRAVSLIQELARWAADTPPEEIADRAAGRLQSDLGFARVRIYLMIGGVPRGVASRGMAAGFDLTKYTLADDDPNALKAFEERRPILLSADELKNDRFFIEFDKTGVRYQLQAPAVSASGRIGLITIDDKDSPTELSPEDVDLLTLVAVAVADGVQASRGRQIQARRLEWLDGLKELDEKLAERSDISEVFDVVITVLSRLLRDDSGLVMIRPESNHSLQVVALSDGLSTDLFRVSHPGTHGLVQRCLQTRGLVSIEDVWTDTDFLTCYYKVENGTAWKDFLRLSKSLVVVPVLCRDEAIGVMVLRFLERTQLTSIDHEFLEYVARRVAIAVAKLQEGEQIKAEVIHHAKLSDLALMSTGVAHGIRNPLQVIRSSLEIARSDLGGAMTADDLRKSIAENLGQIDLQLTRAFVTIDRLLSWSSPQGMNPVLISLRDMTWELLDIVRDHMAAQKISIDLSISERVPPVYISADAIRMALLDLFWNARKAMPHGGTLRIVLAMCGANRVQLEVTDNGMGMSEEKREQLFAMQPYQRLPAGGTGLGLYLLRKILATAGGTIRCESELGKGTTMLVQLPAMPSYSQVADS